MKVWLVIVVCACSSPKPVREPAKLVRPPNQCAAVADRLLAAYAQLENKSPEPKMAAAYRDVVTERCTQDVWSAEAQSCILAANSDLDACTQRLTPEQRASFAEAAQAKLDQIGAAATTHVQ